MKKNNYQFYNPAIKKYGISAKGVRWNSKYSQYKRFEVLTNFIENEIKKSNIVDAGCGFAEYYNYLFDNNLKPKSYIGIDCEEEMITLASKRFLNTSFYIKDIIQNMHKILYFLQRTGDFSSGSCYVNFTQSGAPSLSL